MKNVIQKEKKDERIKYDSQNCPECETELENVNGPEDSAVSFYMDKKSCPKCGAYNVFRF